MKILAAGYSLVTDEHLRMLRKDGYEVIRMEDASAPLPPGAAEAECIVSSTLLNHHPISQFQNLRMVQFPTAGLDRAPVAELEERGIAVKRAVGVYSPPMAEWVVLEILRVFKHSRQFDLQQREHVWKRHGDLKELGGKTACIVGIGDIGTEIAKRLDVFGVEVIGVSRRGLPNAFAKRVVSSDRLLEVLPEADIVVVTTPLTPETRGMIGEEAIAAMKDDATFVNVSRGLVVDQRALEKALDEGKFIGVALDVFDTEPLPADSPLWDIDRVTVSPHNSFAGDGNADRFYKLFVRNLEALER